ncbi:MAG: molybdenum cofactor guanylyltransferase [Dehalococcoidia bacterium]|nr:molybdenum cofactor guanylyltransferase [Dehalococcoidia bacterium]
MTRPTGIILAGGASSRLGADKAQIVLGGQTLLERVVGALEQVAGEILIVASPDTSRPQPGSRVPLRVVTDPQEAGPRRGPLAGLVAGLRECRTPYAWVLGCDSPFLSPRLLSCLMELAPGHDVVAPRSDRHLHVLHAVYSRNCLPAAERVLAGRHPSLQALLPLVRCCYVEGAELARWDPDGRSLLNINTRDDLAEARRLLDQRSTSR